jgi:hypothetical protein
MAPLAIEDRFHRNILENKRLMFTRTEPSGGGETLRDGISDQDPELDRRNVCKLVHSFAREGADCYASKDAVTSGVCGGYLGRSELRA